MRVKRTCCRAAAAGSGSLGREGAAGGEVAVVDGSGVGVPGAGGGEMLAGRVAPQGAAEGTIGVLGLDDHAQRAGCGGVEQAHAAAVPGMSAAPPPSYTASGLSSSVMGERGSC